MISVLNTTVSLVAYAGVIYAVAYTVMNVLFSKKVAGLDSRNKSMLVVISQTIVYSYIMNFLPCILTNNEDVHQAMIAASKQYMHFTVAWLWVLGLLCVGNLFMHISPKYYSDVNKRSLWNLARRVILTAIIGGALSWLIG